MSSIFDRKLPHRDIGQAPIHVTIRLKDSIPKARLAVMREELQHYRRAIEKEAEFSGIDWIQLDQVIATKYGEQMEHLLERELHDGNGPYHLQQPAIRKIIAQSFEWMSINKKVYIYAYCIMGNHLHIILRSTTTEFIKMGVLMKSFKRHTARMCNDILGLTGQNFWEKDYFDRDVRNNTLEQIIRYVLNNPVKAGLVTHWQDWPGTYLNPDWKDMFD